jgi:hypothetical protein
MGRSTVAREYFAKAQVLRHRLAAEDKANVSNQLALAWAYKEQAGALQAAATRQRRNSCGEVRSLYARALDIFEPLAARGALQSESQAAPGQIRKALAECDAAQRRAAQPARAERLARATVAASR